MSAAAWMHPSKDASWEAGNEAGQKINAFVEKVKGESHSYKTNYSRSYSKQDCLFLFLLAIY